MACLVLLHSAAQLQLQNHPQSVWQKELSHAKSCLDVLDHCSDVDKVALRFADTTRGYYNILNGHATVDVEGMGDADVSTVDTLESSDYLFSIPELSPPHLDKIPRDLLKLVGSPFGHPSNLHTEGTLRAGFGSQIEWDSFVTLPFNNAVPKAANSIPLLDMALSSIRSGQFLGPSEPHGWASFRSLNNL